MSFGFGVGDLLTVGRLCWKVYLRVKDSPGNYAELSSEVSSLYAVIKETEMLLSQQNLTPSQQTSLMTCRKGCDDVLRDLDGLLTRYESLGTKSQRTFDRMGFGLQDKDGIRLRLISNVSMLDAFNNASSHARLEKKLNLLISEVRAGKREGSVVSVETFKTSESARNDQETWKALCRELEDVGISANVIREKKDFIIAWFAEAVAAGALEEDPSSESEDLNTEQVGLATNLPQNVALGKYRESLSLVAAQAVPGPGVPEIPTLPKEKFGLRRRIAYLLDRLNSDEGSLSLQLFYAVRAGHVARVHRSLEAGADVNKPCQGSTALIEAAIGGHLDVVAILYSKGANLDSSYSLNSNTALHFAARGGNHKLVQILLDKGAEMKKNHSLNTPLHSAAFWGDSAVLGLLLAKGAEIETTNGKGWTALHVAAKHRRLESARTLLKRGANINAVSLVHETPLHLAVESYDVDMAQLLLDQGADLDARRGNGQTACQQAEQSGYRPVADLLMNARMQRITR